jgi:hypothetical protein
MKLKPYQVKTVNLYIQSIDKGLDLTAKYNLIIKEAVALMQSLPDLEPTSALKECAANAGIQYGPQMLAFMNYANRKLFKK